MAQNDHPLESARKSLDDAIPLLTRNPNTTANVFIEKQTAEREALEQLTDKELLNEAVREIATKGMDVRFAPLGGGPDQGLRTLDAISTDDAPRKYALRGRVI